MKCKICGTRRPRRLCPGVQGEICTLCCGTEREVTVLCPFECPYLRAAHEHERKARLDEVPHADIEIRQSDVEEKTFLLMALCMAIRRAAAARRDLVDRDVIEALEGLIQTYKVARSGLVYEARPQNPMAAEVFQAVQEQIAELRRLLREESPQAEARLRDIDILITLVYLRRLAALHSNGRPKGRPFLAWLFSLPGVAEKEAGAPQERLVITP